LDSAQRPPGIRLTGNPSTDMTNQIIPTFSHLSYNSHDGYFPTRSEDVRRYRGAQQFLG